MTIINDSPLKVETTHKETPVENSTEKAYSIRMIVKDPMQLVFLILSIFSFGCIFPFFYDAYEFVKVSKANAPETYEFPKITDFEITLYSTVFFALLEVIIKKVAYRFLEPYCKEQTDVKSREIRTMKAAQCVFKGIYYTTVTAWGYSVLKDQKWYPVSLGGSGDISIVFDEWPYPVRPPQLKEYFLVILGSHLGALLNHVGYSSNKDFIEMGLHHMVTVVLCSGVYLVNAYHMGAIISLLHDAGDILTCVSRVLAESRDKTFVGPLFLLHMVVWFYTRLMVLPYLIYRIHYFELPSGHSL